MSQFNVGDKVYWHNAPPFDEDHPEAACLIGVMGIIRHKGWQDKWDVDFPNNDRRLGFTDEELVSEEIYNSPLYKALR